MVGASLLLTRDIIIQLLSGSVKLTTIELVTMKL